MIKTPSLMALALLLMTGCPAPNPGAADGQPPPDPIDAGPIEDASPPDLDATPPDPDAALPDAMPPDPDAAVSDAALPDAEPTPDMEAPCVPADEVCDGVDNDCDGAVDEAADGGALTEACYDGPAGTAGVGTCVAGARTCVNGVFGACEGQTLPAVEQCDAVDHDCDGASDDAVGHGDACAVGVGACSAAGRLVCNLELGEMRCDAEAGAPGAEVCDAIDNDCDGATDEGVVERCYEGPDGTEGVGSCVAGERRCVAGAFGQCDAQVLPTVELCDGDDNDCNGATDDVAGLGAGCSNGVGACVANGQVICDAIAGEVRCDAVPGAPADESCDGVDNDCNGEIDDVAGRGAACSAGVGACASDGERVCDLRAGELVCDAVPDEPGEEQCNGVDDDCNGVVDDAPGVGVRCHAGLGMCGAAGRTVCVGESLACDPDEAAEWCRNGLDDDEDGEADEGGCLWPCEADPDCPSDGECRLGACDFGGCDVDDDCPERTQCEADACTPGDCRENGDCDVGQICDRAFCVPGDCQTDDDCAGAQICDQLRCVEPPASCADVPSIRGFGSVAGSTVDAPAELTGSCGASRGPERVYQLRLDHVGTVCLDTFGSSYDTVVHVREACERRDTQIGCNDDWGGTNESLRSRVELELGLNQRVFVVVDGFNGLTGDFRLNVQPGPCGAACESDDVCTQFARCQQPPADLPRVAFEVDGAAQCGRDVCNGGEVIEGLAPWPAYAAFYTGGSVIYDVNNQRQHAGISIAVDGDTRASAPNIPGLVDEAAVQAAYAGLSTSAFAVEPDSLVEAFFLDTFCGDNAGATQAEVRPISVCSDQCAFDDDCRAGDACRDRRCSFQRDTDRDGLADHLDLDDDDDGIPDAIECFGPGSMIQNGDFERPDPPDPALTNFSVRVGEVPAWSTLPAGRFMEFWRDGFSGIAAPNGDWFIELNAGGRDTIYQDLQTTPGMRYEIRFQHRGRLGVEAMALHIGAPGATVEVLRAETDQEWVEYTARYIVPADQPVTRFAFVSLVDGSLGNLLDAVHVVPRCDGEVDADGDGLPNHRDTDADGDGVLDVDEAGHGLTLAQLRESLGANGLSDAVETGPDSGDLRYDIVDTDADGVPDYLQP